MRQAALAAVAGTRPLEAELRHDARREGLAMFGLVAPALVLIGLVALVPVCMLVVLSFINETGSPTLQNYLRLLDGQAYARVFSTTFRISFATTAVCVVLAVPVAYLFSRLRERTANLMMIAVLVPLWTSVLVRTYAWMVILQRNGLVNQAGMALGWWSEPLALTLNEIGVLVGTVQIMLPYMILPIYGAMRKVDPAIVRAASSLGATPLRAFVTVFLPLSLPGILAGCLVTFVLCLGFYVVPEILGGGKVVMMAIQAAKDVQLFYNWGAAAALGVVLLAMTVALMALAHRFVPRRLGGAHP
jgi:putative spermidine/putrescine transport system permease protein/spermidine/putrescine transport system permease protein